MGNRSSDVKRGLQTLTDRSDRQTGIHVIHDIKIVDEDSCRGYWNTSPSDDRRGLGISGLVNTSLIICLLRLCLLEEDLGCVWERCTRKVHME
jgi:hypothetical protein